MSRSSRLRTDAAWGIVVVSFVVTLISTGIRFAAGPFVAPLQHDFGFSLPDLSGVFAAAMLVYGLGMAVAGRLADLWGTRRVLVGGSLLLVASLILAARTTSPRLFALVYILPASFGFAATSQTVLSPLIGRWFDRHRGLAMTFLSSGAMGGIAVMTPLATALIGWIGWRETYLLFALLFLVVLLPITLWALPAGESPATVGAAGAVPNQRRHGLRTALGSRSFYNLAVSFFGCGFSMNLLGTHGVPMLEHHGFPAMTAAFGIGLIGLVSIFGSLAVGAASDRLGRPNFLALIYLVRGLGFLALVALGQEWELYLTATVGGLVWAGSSALTSAITADLFGVSAVGTLFGLLYLGHQFGAAAGTYLGGWSVATFGSYTVAFATAALLLFAGALLSLRLGRPQPISRGTGIPA